jgi:hypothetical protein
MLLLVARFPTLVSQFPQLAVTVSALPEAEL